MIDPTTFSLAQEAVKNQFPMMMKADADELAHIASGMWKGDHEQQHATSPASVYEIGPYVVAASDWMKAIGKNLPQATVLSIPWEDVPWTSVPWYWLSNVAKQYANANAYGPQQSPWEKTMSDEAKASIAASLSAYVNWTAQSFEVGNPNSQVPGNGIEWSDIAWASIPWATMNWTKIPWNKVDWSKVQDMQSANTSVALAVALQNQALLNQPGQQPISQQPQKPVQNQPFHPPILNIPNQAPKPAPSPSPAPAPSPSPTQPPPTNTLDNTQPPNRTGLYVGLAIVGVAAAIFWATLAQKPAPHAPKKTSGRMVPYSLRTGKRVSEKEFRSAPNAAYEWKRVG